MVAKSRYGFRYEYAEIVSAASRRRRDSLKVPGGLELAGDSTALLLAGAAQSISAWHVCHCGYHISFNIQRRADLHARVRIGVVRPIEAWALLVRRRVVCDRSLPVGAVE